MFLECIPGRKMLYDKGNSVATDGYTTRKLTKGTDNVMVGFNGVCFGDSKTVVSM
jgi:hypothetical protein